MEPLAKKTDFQQMLKVPPHDIDAEQSVLGALMIDTNALIKIVDTLATRDFYKAAHQRIYDAMLGLYEKRQPIDILSVSSRLKERNQFDDIGGHSYLTSLASGVPTASHVAHYAQIVREKRVLRDLISTSFEIVEDSFSAHGEKNIDAMLDDVGQKILKITQYSVTQQFARLSDELEGTYERIEELNRSGGRKLRGVATGFDKLDLVLSGLQESDLILLGARPSVGKTSFVLDIARSVGIKQKAPVGIFSLEMSREQIVERLIAAEAQVSLWELRTGKLKDETDLLAIQEALERMSQSNIFIDDTPSPNILQMRAMARRLQMEHGLSLLIVDYLQLIQPRNPRDNMVQQITEISRGLKSLARELKIPVIALSQLSRGVEQRDNKIPRLSDLRESGSLEQDADIVMFIYRKDRDGSQVMPEEQNMTEIIIAKHRNGALGKIPLRFDPTRASFRNVDIAHSDFNEL